MLLESSISNDYVKVSIDHITIDTRYSDLTITSYAGACEVYLPPEQLTRVIIQQKAFSGKITPSYYLPIFPESDLKVDSADVYVENAKGDISYSDVDLKYSNLYSPKKIEVHTCQWLLMSSGVITPSICVLDSSDITILGSHCYLGLTDSLSNSVFYSLTMEDVTVDAMPPFTLHLYPEAISVFKNCRIYDNQNHKQLDWLTDVEYPEGQPVIE